MTSKGLAQHSKVRQQQPKTTASGLKTMEDNRHSSVMQRKIQHLADRYSEDQQSAKTTDSPIQRYTFIDSDPPQRKTGVIYGIFKAPYDHQNLCEYVGQVEEGRYDTRWKEHQKDDADKPWQETKASSANYQVYEIGTFNNVTRLEITMLEQYYVEEYAKIGAKLRNKVNPITLATMNKYKQIAGNFDAKECTLTNSWEPQHVNLPK